MAQSDEIVCVAKMGSYSHPGVGHRGKQFSTTGIKGRQHIVSKRKLRCHFLDRGDKLLDRQKKQMFTNAILHIFVFLNKRTFLSQY